MRKLILFYTIVIISLILGDVKAQNSGVSWLKSIDGSMLTFHSVVDSQGNIYLSGMFNGNVDFDPDSTSFFLSSGSTGPVNGFVAKLDSLGSFIWAKKFHSSEFSRVDGIELLNDNRIVILGTFYGSIDCDPGPSDYIFNSSHPSNLGDQDIFITVIDKHGNFIRAGSIRGDSHQFSGSLSISESKDIIVTGSIIGITDFDPLPGVHNQTPSGPWKNGFFVKIDSNLNHIWAKLLRPRGSPGGEITIDNSSISSNGEIYLTGNFEGKVDFDTGPGLITFTTPGSNSDMFLAKYDSAGNLVWVKSLMNTGNNSLYDSKIDSKNNLIVSGKFSGPMNFGSDSLPHILTNYSSDGYLAKYDDNGNLIWANNYSNSLHCGTISILSNDYYVTNIIYNDVIDVDPGVDTFYLQSLNGVSSTFQKLDSNGNFINAWNLRGIGVSPVIPDYSSSNIDTSDLLIVGRFFNSHVDFDPGPLILNPGVRKGSFIMKMKQSYFGPDSVIYGLGIDNHAGSSIRIYPNPSSYFLTIEFENQGEINLNLFNSVGQEFVINYQKIEGKLILNTSELLSGIYFLKVTIGDTIKSEKILIKH